MIAYTSLSVAERVSAHVHLSDFFVIMAAMVVCDRAANFSIEIEQALRQAVLLTTIQLVQTSTALNFALFLALRLGLVQQCCEVKHKLGLD